MTRGKKSNHRVPRIRTKTDRKTFSYQGEQSFNSLPSELKNESSIGRFKKKCNVLNF